MTPPTSKPTAAPKRYQKKIWVVERRCRAVFTMLVEGKNRKEALENVYAGKAEGCDTSYHSHGPARILREDKIRICTPKGK